MTSCRMPMTLMLGIIVLIVMLIYDICMPIFAYDVDDGVELFVLMYHNIVPDGTKNGMYEIRPHELENDLKIISNMGIDVVTPSDLYLYQEGKKSISSKAVMLTFDDGYYSYVRYLIPLLERYDMRAVVNVVGEYTKYNKHNPNTSPRYTYLDLEDIRSLQESGRVEIGLHSYRMHHIKNGVQGVGQRKGESDADYRIRLLEDTKRLIHLLDDIGVSSDIYAYPYGSYSRCSDRVLKEVGIRCTLSCSEGINHINRTSSLYLLKRYNRDGRCTSIADMYDFFA